MEKQNKREVIIKYLTMSEELLKEMSEMELQETIQRINQIKEQSVQDGRYLDAQDSKEKLKVVQRILNEKLKRDLKTHNKVQNIKLNERLAKEMENFKEYWNEKIRSYQEDCQKMEQKLIDHNKKTIIDYKEELESSIPLKGKDSKQLLALKTKIDQLAKNEEYKDAHYLQMKAVQIEKEEQKNYKIERQNKITKLIDQKIVVHQNEYFSLRKRILNGLNELEIQRKKEYDELYQKF